MTATSPPDSPAQGAPRPLRGVSISTAFPDPALLELPWELPLEQWPPEVLATYPRGLSRHVVRFARVGPKVVAVKETTAHYARREYGLLRKLQPMSTPSVVPDSVVTDRYTSDGEPLPAALVTDHLSFSLPYRTIFEQVPAPETIERLVDALALLIVQLHLSGFYWGDVSLSNTLFRRDAGAFAAYLVDAETGELHPQLTPGQRGYDIDLARTNVAGEVMDLLAGEDMQRRLLDVGVDPASVDPFEISQRLVDTYEGLWEELTATETFPVDDRWRVQARVERLNDLGFDVEEASLDKDETGQVHLRPRVVEPGHHARRLLHLTGLNTQENQARRILTDIHQFGHTLYPGLPEDLTAQLWMREVFVPIMEAIPGQLRRKREPAQIIHEVLEHRWFMSESARADIPTLEAVRDYVKHYLAQLPDEKNVF
ncbi:LPS kinase [Kocuria varians]